MKLNVVVDGDVAVTTYAETGAYVEFERIFNKAWKLEKVHGFTNFVDLAACFKETIKNEEIECFILGNPATSVINRKSNIMKILLEEKPVEL